MGKAEQYTNAYVPFQENKEIKSTALQSFTAADYHFVRKLSSSGAFPFSVLLYAVFDIQYFSRSILFSFLLKRTRYMKRKTMGVVGS